ncbi:MAG: RDD family protein [Cypionkella sp.]|jgi:uncharacterized RDD family membrane protein YckC|nr:RDD family protein [Cypionkella sp.]
MSSLLSDPTAAMQPDPIRHAEFYEGILFKRFMAWVFDLVLIALLTALVVPFTAFTALFFLPVLFLVIGFLYRWVTLSGRSATWGMRILRIEFCDRQGQRFDTGTALIWTVGYTLSMAFLLPQLLSIALMFLSQRRQGLTDHLLGSVAINSPARR